MGRQVCLTMPFHRLKTIYNSSHSYLNHNNTNFYNQSRHINKPSQEMYEIKNTFKEVYACCFQGFTISAYLNIIVSHNLKTDCKD